MECGFVPQEPLLYALEVVSDRQLMLKMCFLLALASAKRASKLRRVIRGMVLL